jgi:protein-tyrosine phosphatase
MSTTILFVCHANLCRSPMAERLARQLATGRGRIAIGSAGTHAREGLAMHPGAAEVLRDRGADPSGFRSRGLTVDLLDRADLVLAATREQRSYCVSLAPSTLRRAFTITQFGRLASAVDADRVRGSERLESLLDAMAVVRAEFQPALPDEDDLADPVLGTPADMALCAKRIQAALEPAIGLIAGSGSS